MKKIIMILLVICLYGCSPEAFNTHDGDHIASINSRTGGKCYYETREHTNGFYAPCNLYQVNDIVHFTKDTTK